MLRRVRPRKIFKFGGEALEDIVHAVQGRWTDTARMSRAQNSQSRVLPGGFHAVRRGAARCHLPRFSA